MGLFSPRRDPDDPAQLAIAVHELGHAWSWRVGGLIVGQLRHSGDQGDCPVRYWPEPDQLRAFAIGCWAGYEAEDRWRRANGLGRARRGNSSHDIRLFRAATRELTDGRLSESKARALARKHINQHWKAITTTAPRLIAKGRLSL